MARFLLQPNVGENLYQTFKAPATYTDADIGKPVKISTTRDEIVLCADGNEIWGFIATVEPALVDGKKLVTVMTRGRMFVELDGAADNIGQMVEAAANAAAGTANTAGATAYGYVSKHVIDVTSTTTVSTSTFKKNWIILSGLITDEAVVLIESC